MVSSANTKQQNYRKEEDDSSGSSFPVARGSSIVKTQLQAFRQPRAKHYMALQVETSDTNGAATMEDAPIEDQGGAEETMKAQHPEEQLSPSETTRRLVDSFRRRGESPSNASAPAKTWGSTNVRPMSPVSEGFLENLQSQRQRAEERVQVIKKLRQLKEQQTKPGTPESRNSSKASIASGDEAGKEIPKGKVQNMRQTKSSATVSSPRVPPNVGWTLPVRNSFEVGGSEVMQETQKPIESGALRHYGEIQGTRYPIRSITHKDQSNEETVSKVPKSWETKVKPTPAERDGTHRPTLKPVPVKPMPVVQNKAPKKDEPEKVREPANMKFLSNARLPQTCETRETPATRRNDRSPNSKQVQVDLRESHISSSSSEDDASLTVERDRANSFLVELAKAKAEILELQQRLAASDNASQATRDELSKARQQRTPFWKRGAKKHQLQAGLGIRTAEDNQDFVTQLMNVVHTLPVCDEICLRINLVNGEGGWEIVSARAENPRLKEDDISE